MKRASVRIAIQKSGRLRKKSESLLKSWGIDYQVKDGGVLIVASKDNKFEILLVRYGDIPQYVASGTADFGIVGENILYEENLKLKQVKKLGFGKCRLIIASPARSAIKSTKDLEGERIATSYPVSLKKFLKKEDCTATIVKIKGGVEAAPALGLADAVCDITQTGKTLKANGLEIIVEIIKSEAVVIESPFLRKPAINFKKKILES
jgi:ATP phosphoribosyltransferase